ncbi:DUF2059 domain-containing protein [Niveispirillum sp. BGYR6]|uniref:DUF2059 domain-containing protein n=1 Tax=Niveispirillum sp. BGYR6 TaxID=2971249 RepID=UPI0022B94FA0|nr:DUF2059 domain-containing protein [Niveispirillum sp. BGYR6]MDG5497122.1 DUF2059 domain-containing protein [Niveispirillum sp. BGYR6]
MGLLWAAQPAMAAPDDNAQRLEKARALIETTGMATISQQIMDGLMGQVEKMALAQNPGREKDIHTLVQDHIRPALKNGLPELMQGMEALYASNFTVDEMDQIITFYRTPVGRKSLQQMPQIMQQSMALGQAWASKIMAQAGADFTAAAKQRGLKL